MKRYFDKHFSGIHGRIIKNVFILTGVMFFLVVITTIILMHLLHAKVDNNELEERELVETQSRDAVMDLVSKSFLNSITWEADQMDDEFWIMIHDFNVIAEQVKAVLENPSDYVIKDLQPPKKELDGTYSLQFLCPAGYDKNNPDVSGKLGRLANLEPMIRKMLIDNEGYTTFDCYIALPDGGTIVVDKHSADKFDEDGKIRAYDPRTREWFKGAVNTGKIYFTEDVRSVFYNTKEITWGMPVYVGGELQAVLEGCSFMDLFEKKLGERNIGETGFSVMISDKGHVVYSPRTSGVLAQDADNTTDVREVASESLADAVRKGIDQETGFAEVDLDGETYYTAYAPIDTIGWTVMMFISEKELEQPSNSLIQKMTDISEGNMDDISFYIMFGCATILVFVLIIVLVISAIISRRTRQALYPIRSMTGEIEQLNRDNVIFEMKDTYRTGDEIEVLADRFADMTVRMKDYMGELVEMTSREERINAEIQTAGDIQLAMLPKMTDAISSREEFDIHTKMVPARQVGGDFFDYFMVDDNHLAFVIGDVSGKGITAALFMVLAKNTIQNQVIKYGTDIVKAVTEANKLLIRDNDTHLFVTVWIGVLELDSGVLKFVDAGHDYAAIGNSRGDFTTEPDNHSMLMGIVDYVPYKLNQIELNDGDTIYLYTDGITEARNSKEEMYGLERMIDTLNKDTSLSVEELDRAVREDIDAFVDGYEQFDDITSVCIRYYKHTDL